MKVCSYCHVTVSESDLVCPRDGQPPIEVQPALIDRELEDRFDSIEFFGSGSTGDLYLASDSRSQQHGVLKILRTTSRNNAADRMRIKRELSKQTSFSKHVVPVIAVGESGNEQAAEKLLWLFRQRIEGESLKVYLKREGRLRVSTAIGIAAQMVMGLDTIHRAGLLHRDVKPGHVIVQSHAPDLPKVVLLDTGIPARIETKSLFDLVGTPEYISPEQIGGKLNSFRSDLYALGCVFYQMLVGRPPFIGEDTDAVFKAHQTEPPPVPDVDLPAPLRSLIASLLAKEPRERPFSGQQVFRVLEPFLPSSPLFKSSSVSSPSQTPQPVVTNQPTKTVSGVVSSASVPPPVPSQARRGPSSPPRLSGIKGSVPPPPPPGVRSSNAPRPVTPPASVVPVATAGVKSSVPPPVVRTQSSVPPPPPPGVRGSSAPRPATPPASVVPVATTLVKSSVPPSVVGTQSSVPPPKVPQGPTAIPRDVQPNNFVPITATGSSDAAQQADGETPKEVELILEDIAEPKVDIADTERLEDYETIPGERQEAIPPIATEESSASDGNDPSDQSEEIETARIKSPTLEKVLSVSAGDTLKEHSADALERLESTTGPTHQSTRPSVDFQVEQLFEDEPPQGVSPPSGLAQEAYRPSEGAVEVSHDIRVQPVADPEGTAPIRMRRRYDRRVIIGVIGGLVFSAVLLFALNGRESDSDKRVEVKPVPKPTSPASDDERTKAVSSTPPAKAPSESAAEEEPPKENQPTEIAKQNDQESEPREESGKSKRSSRSKTRKTSARASSRDTDSDESGSAAKLRTEAREHYAAGRYKSAATAYRKITKMKPSDAGAFAGLGASYLALNRARRAIKAYKSAIKLQPKNSGFHAALARAYATKGDRNRAVKTYQKALKINPKNRIAKVALQQLTQK